MSSSEQSSPEYGAYASPEEQAKRRGSVSNDGATTPQERTSLGAPEPAAGQRPGQPGAAAYPWTSQRRTSRFVASGADRIVTLILLALAVINVISTAPSLLEFGPVMSEFYTSMDAEPFTAFALAKAMGLAALVAQVLLLIAVVFWSIARLRIGRAAWWIPVLGGVTAWALVTLAIVVLLVADPLSVAAL